MMEVKIKALLVELIQIVRLTNQNWRVSHDNSDDFEEAFIVSDNEKDLCRITITSGVRCICIRAKNFDVKGMEIAFIFEESDLPSKYSLEDSEHLKDALRDFMTILTSVSAMKAKA